MSKVKDTLIAGSVVLATFGGVSFLSNQNLGKIEEKAPETVKEKVKEVVPPPKVEAAPKPVPQPAAPAPQPSTGPAVKMSNTEICHEKGSTYYAKTTNFTAYNSINECLADGGRLPKR